jgi:hypothetical protein
LRLENGTIGYIQNISIIKSQWTQENHLMHPFTIFFVDLNKFIKNTTLYENITLQSLRKNVIPITLISKTFSYHHYIPKSFNINRY